MKLRNILILLVLIVFITGCSDNKNTDSIKFKEEYESLNGVTISSNSTLKHKSLSISNDNIIKYADYNQLEKVLNGTGIIYLGYPECPWCRQALPVLLEASEEAGISVIYYMNFKNERDIKEIINGEIVTSKEGTDGYYNLLSRLDNVLNDYIIKDENGKEYNTGEKRFLVPFVIFVKDGVVIGTNTATVESHTNPFIDLTNEQYEELMIIYLNNMYKLLGIVCDEGC